MDNLLQSPAWPALQSLNARLQTLVGNTHLAQSGDGGGDPWEVTYDLVFSDNMSRKIHAALSELGTRLEYYDPDTSYEEDVVAFANAVDDKTQALAAVLAQPSASHEPSSW